LVKYIKPIKIGQGGRRKSRSGRSRTPGEYAQENTFPSMELHDMELHDRQLDSDLQSNLQQLMRILDDCSDVVYREFAPAGDGHPGLALVFVDGLVDKTLVSDQIMHSLMLDAPLVRPGDQFTGDGAFKMIRERLLPYQQMMETGNLGRVIDAVLAGETVLLVDGCARALINDVKGWEMRSITESQTEIVIRGPREAFVESIRVNTSLLRRKIKNPNLKIEALKLGRVTKTDLAVAYIKGIANEKLVAEIKERLSRIEIDAILETGYIEELIEDSPRSPFPTVGHTERPDKAAAQLLEGRAAVLVDGTPHVLTVPFLFIESLQFPEDYYERWVVSSAVRLLRLVFLMVSLVLPSFYVAVVTFHHELLPTPLLLSLAAQREAIPYPAVFEVLIMELSFEVLREAGVRLPRQVGQAVSIVGALVVGLAAVQAGLVAAATVIIVALTGIASFTTYYSTGFAIRFLRFPLLVLAGSLGLYGLLCGLLALLIHLASLRSFGVPYLSPAAPFHPGEQKDMAIRVPWWAMLYRPRLAGTANPRRETAGLEPAPPPPGQNGPTGDEQ